MRRALLIIGLTSLLGGCGGGNDDPVSDLRAMVESPPPEPNKKALPKLPKPVKPVNVAFGELERSPFAAIPGPASAEGDDNGEQGPRPDPDREADPLEQYALGDLRIVATVRLPEEGWQAYIQGPDDLIHTLRPGDHMGRNYGRVERITANGVVLRELVQKPGGNWQPRKRTIEIRPTGN